MRNTQLYITIALASLAAPVWALPAQTPPPEAPTTGVEDIVVTAQRRA